MMKWMQRRGMTTKPTTNNLLRVTLPNAVTKDFEIVVEDTVNNFLPSGIDRMYGVRNRLTGLVEIRGAQLSMMVMAMQNMQQVWDKVLTGEMNGYHAVPPAVGDTL